MQEQSLEKLQEEFERFIQFAEVLDKPSRRYFVAYLREQLLAEPMEEETLQSEYFNYFKEALNDLFQDEDLRTLAKDNQLLGEQILVDTLHWFRKTYGELSKKHPFEDEQRELESWGVRHLRQFCQSYNYLIQKVSSYYLREEIDPGFHQDKFKVLIGGRPFDDLSAPECEQIERVFKDLLAQWDARLTAKIFTFQMKHLREAKDQFQSKVEAKVQEFKKLSSLIKPFTEHIGRYWDMSRALWEEQTLDLIKLYDALLKDEKELKRLADLLGAMRKAELEIEEEHYEKVIEFKEWRKDPNLRTEIVGVSHGKDLNNVLPTEVALFGGHSEWQFLKRFADEQLQVNQFEDQVLEESTRVYSESFQRVKKKEKGPFIVCVDTSGSMEGEPERIAKVLCFAILKMAAADERRAFLINFSSGIHTIDLYNLVDSINEVAAFLQKSFHGGTDISLALNEALQQLETHGYRDADVLVISDFIMYKISDDLEMAMEKQQHNRGTQFHSLVITDQANEEVISQFDNAWTYDPYKKGVLKRIYGDLKGIAGRKI
jgi:uncharacterized protein with von Willebrand factor type A (vWA) domain